MPSFVSTPGLRVNSNGGPLNQATRAGGQPQTNQPQLPVRGASRAGVVPAVSSPEGSTTSSSGPLPDVLYEQWVGFDYRIDPKIRIYFTHEHMDRIHGLNGDDWKTARPFFFIEPLLTLVDNQNPSIPDYYGFFRDRERENSRALRKLLNITSAPNKGYRFKSLLLSRQPDEQFDDHYRFHFQIEWERQGDPNVPDRGEPKTTLRLSFFLNCGITTVQKVNNIPLSNNSRRFKFIAEYHSDNDHRPFQIVESHSAQIEGEAFEQWEQTQFNQNSELVHVSLDPTFADTQSWSKSLGSEGPSVDVVSFELLCLDERCITIPMRHATALKRVPQPDEDEVAILKSVYGYEISNTEARDLDEIIMIIPPGGYMPVPSHFADVAREDINYLGLPNEAADRYRENLKAAGTGDAPSEGSSRIVASEQDA